MGNMTKEQYEEMNQNHVACKEIAPEFGSWPMNEVQIAHANEIRHKFDEVLSVVSLYTSPQNARYLSIVKTKLEEASFFAIKGIAKP